MKLNALLIKISTTFLCLIIASIGFKM
jgi:hypothetical protein